MFQNVTLKHNKNALNMNLIASLLQCKRELLLKKKKWVCKKSTTWHFDEKYIVCHDLASYYIFLAYLHYSFIILLFFSLTYNTFLSPGRKLLPHVAFIWFNYLICKLITHLFLLALRNLNVIFSPKSTILWTK